MDRHVRARHQGPYRELREMRIRDRDGGGPARLIGQWTHFAEYCSIPSVTRLCGD